MIFFANFVLGHVLLIFKVKRYSTSTLASLVVMSKVIIIVWQLGQESRRDDV